MAPSHVFPRLQTCVIFNPAARGNKAQHFRRHLDEIAAQCALKATSGPGDARRLAADAVADGFDLIVAAGGDGTVNEVLNGLGDAPEGFTRARLGVLPLGTVNVFARELRIPLPVESAWAVLQRNRELKIDLPRVDYVAGGVPQRRYFVQLAGGGMDARAIELVDWPFKKKFGRLAYLIAGVRALRETKSTVTVQAEGRSVAGELILIGNGRYYGGAFEIFPSAHLRSGCLDVCAVPQMNWLTLLGCLPNFMVRQKLPESRVRRLQGKCFTLTGPGTVAFELDGEWAGHLPATFSVEPHTLRVAVP